jgi:hypothetical protein
MKRTMMAVVFFFTATCIVSAQSTKTGHKQATKKEVHAKTTKKTKVKKAPKNKILLKQDSVDLSNRKIYHWTNGQRSTPTGQDASAVGSGYAAIRKDTAKVIVKKGKAGDNQ